MSTCDIDVSVSSCAAVFSAVTVTASLTPASLSEIGTSSGTGDLTSTGRWTGAKPWTSTWISYGLKGTLKNWYAPAASVVVSVLKPVMSFRRLDDRTGHGAPVGTENVSADGAGGGMGFASGQRREQQGEGECDETRGNGPHGWTTPQLATKKAVRSPLREERPWLAEPAALFGS